MSLTSFGDHDDVFRLALAVLCAVFMPLGLYHRLRARSGERLDRRQEGVFILLGLRLAALAMFAGGLVWMIEPDWMAWSALPLPAWLRWVGVVAAATAGLLLVWTMHTLGRNLTDTVVTRKDHHLVTGGPYRWVRHPFYLACAVGVAAGSLVTANWLFLVVGGAALGLLVARTRIEEEKLIERFGDDYRDYMQRVGRFAPRIR